MTKVVENATETLYRDVAIVELQTTDVTSRADGGGLTVSPFEGISIDAGSLRIETGGDAQISANVETSGDTVIDAAGEFGLKDLVLSEGGLVDSISSLTSGGAITITSDGLAEFDVASDITVAEDLTVTTQGDLDFGGKATVTGRADLTAARAAGVDARLTTGTGLAVTSGSGEDVTIGLAADILAGTVAADDGDITLTGSGGVHIDHGKITAQDLLTVTAQAGAIIGDGMDVAAARMSLQAAGDIRSTTGAFIFDVDELVSAQSTTGNIDIRDLDEVTLTDITAQAGDVTATASGELIATAISASGHAITLRTTAESGGAERGAHHVRLGDVQAATVTLDSSGGITALDGGDAVTLVAEALHVTSTDSVTLTNLAIDSLDARVQPVTTSGGGTSTELRLGTIGAGTLTVDRLVNTAGTIDLSSTRSLALASYGSRAVGAGQEVTSGVYARSLPGHAPAGSDVTLTSGGSISSDSEAAQIVVASSQSGGVTLDAATGIEGVVVDAEWVDLAQTQTGGIALNLTTGQGYDVLNLGALRALDGDVSVTSNVGMLVWSLGAREDAADVELTAAGGDLRFASDADRAAARAAGDMIDTAPVNTLTALSALDASGDVVAGVVQNVTLNASGVVEIPADAWIDAQDTLTVITGQAFDLPATQSYAADHIVVTSAKDITSTGGLVLGTVAAGDTSVTLNSGRDISLFGGFTRADGSAVEQVSIVATGTDARLEDKSSEATGRRVLKDGSGVEYVEADLLDDQNPPAGDLHIVQGGIEVEQFGTNVHGDPQWYVFSARLPNNYVIDVVADNPDGTGTLRYAWTDAWGNTIVGNPLSAFDAGYGFTLIGRTSLDVTARFNGVSSYIGIERPTDIAGDFSFTLTTPNTAGTDTVDTVISAPWGLVVDQLNAIDGVTSYYDLNTGAIIAYLDSAGTVRLSEMAISNYSHSIGGVVQTEPVSIIGSSIPATEITNTGQKVTSGALRPVQDVLYESVVAIDLAATAYGNIDITSSSLQGENGEVHIGAVGDLDMDRISINATDIVGLHAFGAGSDVIGTGTIVGDHLYARAEGTINLITDVNSAHLWLASDVTGQRVDISNAGALDLITDIYSGEVQVVSGGSVLLRHVGMEHNSADNRLIVRASDSGVMPGEAEAHAARTGFSDPAQDLAEGALANRGGVIIDFVNVGALGAVDIATTGIVREYLDDDATDLRYQRDLDSGVDDRVWLETHAIGSIDVFAGTFNAVADVNPPAVGPIDVARYTRLEFASTVGWGESATVGYAVQDAPVVVTDTHPNVRTIRDGDGQVIRKVFEIAGAYTGNVSFSTVDPTIEFDIQGLRATENIYISAPTVNITGDVSAALGVNIQSTGDITIADNARIENEHWDYELRLQTTGSIHSGPDSVIDATGWITLHTEGNMTLGDVSTRRDIWITTSAAGGGDVVADNLQADFAVQVISYGDIRGHTETDSLKINAATILALTASRNMDVDLIGGTTTIRDVYAQNARIDSYADLTIGDFNWTVIEDLTVNIAGTFNAWADRGVTVGGTLTVENAAFVDLDQAGMHDFGTIDIRNTATVEIADRNALVLTGTGLGNITVAAVNGLTVEALSGATLHATAATIDGDGPVAMSGLTTLIADQVTLLGDNYFWDIVATVTGALTINETDHLGLYGTAGSLDATAGGDLWMGAMAVTGSARIEGANIYDFSTGNYQSGLTAFAGPDGQIILNDNSLYGAGLTIGRARHADVYSLHGFAVDGHISDYAWFNTGGTLRLGDGASLSATNYFAVSAADVVVGDITAGTGFYASVNPGGSITTGTGAMDITGTTTFDAAGATISVTNATNRFDGDVIAIGDQATVAAGGVLRIGGTITGSGSLTAGQELELLNLVGNNLTLTGAGISQVTGQGVTLTGVATLDSEGRALVLDGVNDLAEVRLTDVGDAEIRDINGMVLGTSDASGRIQIDTLGALGQAGAVDFDGELWLNTDLTLPGGFDIGLLDITLGAGGNQFGGTLRVGLADDVTIHSGAEMGLVEADIRGDLTIVSTGRVHNDNGWVVAGDTSITAIGQAVELTADHDFQGLVSVTAGSLTINDINDLRLGAVTLTGDLIASFGGHLTGEGAIVVDGTTTLNGTASSDATLLHGGNDFGGAVSALGLRALSLHDSDALALGRIDVDAGLTVTAGGAVSGDAALTVGGDTQVLAAGQTVSLTASANAFAGTVSITGQDIEVRDSTDLVLADITATGNAILRSESGVNGTGVMAVTGTTRIFAGSADVSLLNGGSSFGGLVTVTGGAHIALSAGSALRYSGSTNGTDKDLTLTAGGELRLDSGVLVTGDATLAGQGLRFADTVVLGNLSADAGALALQQDAASTLRVDGAASFGGGSVTVDQTLILTGGLTVTATGDAHVVQTGALTIAGTNVGGTLLIEADADVTQTGAMIAGTLDLRTAATADVTLTHAANDLGAVQMAQVANLSLTDTGAMTIGALDVTGDLLLTVDNATGTGAAVTVGGTTTLAATGHVTMGHADNVFAAVTGAAGALTLVDSTALELGALTITGALDATSGGEITQTAAISVGGTSRFDANLNTLTLTEAANSFGGMVTLVDGHIADLTATGALAIGGYTGNDLTVTATGDVSFGALEVIGVADVTAGGSMTQFGALSLQGDAALEATGTITLNDVTNYVGGALDMTATGVSLATSANDMLILGEVAVGVGGLAVTSGEIVQAQDVALTVAAGGPSALTATNGILILEDAQFGGSTGLSAAGQMDVTATGPLNLVSLNGGAGATLTVDDGVTLGATSVAGDLTLSGLVALGGDVTAQNVTLTGAGAVDMNDHVVTATTGNVSITATGDLTLGQAVANNGDVTMISQTGSLIDGYGSTRPNVVMTSGALSLQAATGTPDMELVSSAAGPFVADAAGVIQVKADSLGSLSGTGDLNLISSGALAMGAGAVIETDGDVTVSAGGDITIATIIAGSDNTITVTTDHNVIALPVAEGLINLSAHEILWDVAGQIGHNGSRVAIETTRHSNDDNGIINFARTPAGARMHLDAREDVSVITSRLSGAGDTAFAVTGALDVTSDGIDLKLMNDATLGSLFTDLTDAEFKMGSGTLITSDGAITIGADLGIQVNQIQGSTVDAGQVVQLISDQGRITDGSSGETFNLRTAGTLHLTAGSIGSGGTGDIELDAGLLHVTTTSASGGDAAIKSQRSDATLLGDSSLTGALRLVANGDLSLVGDLTSAGMDIDLTRSNGTGRVLQGAGTQISSNGTVAMRSTTDIVLGDLRTTQGDVILDAGQSVSDLGLAGAAITMTGGALRITAHAIGGAADGDALDIDVVEVASVVSTNADTGARSINLASTGTTNLDELVTDGLARFVHADGDLTLIGSVSAAGLEMRVTDGNLLQEAQSGLVVSGDVALTATDEDANDGVARGDMALASVVSLTGDITLAADGALRDGSTDRETAILRSGAADGAVSIAAESVGSAALGGEIEVQASQLASLIARTGDAHVRMLVGGELTGATVAGKLDLDAGSGDLAVTQTVTAGEATLTAAEGGITMSDPAILQTTGTVRMTAGDGDLILTQIDAQGATGPLVALAASGAILDGAGTGITTNGQVTLAGGQIGSAANRLGVEAARIGSILSEGDALITAAGVNGAIEIGGAAVFDGTLDVVVTAGDVTLTDTQNTEMLSLIVQAGSLTQADSARAVAEGDLTLTATGDITLTGVQTTDGLIALDAGATGRILDGTAAEADLITGLRDSARLTLNGIGIGQSLPDGDGTNPADLDVSIAQITQILGGAQGVYLQSSRGFDMGPLNIAGDLEIDVTAGDLRFTADQTARSAKIDVDFGTLTQVDGTTLTTTGTAAQANSGDLSMTSFGDLTLTRVVANWGDVTVASSAGDVIDGSAAEGAGAENIVIRDGVLTLLEGGAVGNRFEAGAIDIDAMEITQITARDGDAFVRIAGAVAQTVQIGDVSATDDNGNVGVTVLEGNLELGSLTAGNDARVMVAGTAGATGLLVGDITVGGSLDLTSTEGGIAQMADTAILADSAHGETSLTAGGAITLANTGNDFGTATLTAGGTAALTDRDDLRLRDATAGGDLALVTGGRLYLTSDATASAQGTLSIEVQDHDLVAEARATVTATGGMTIDVANGNLLAQDDSTWTTGGVMDVDVAGDVRFAGDTQVSAQDALMIALDGAFVADGQTQLTTTSGTASVVSRQSGEIRLQGATTFSGETGVTLQTAEGDIALVGDTVITTVSGPARFVIGQNGDLSGLGTTDVDADSIEIDLGVDSDMRLEGTTDLTATSGDITATLADGEIELLGSSTLIAAGGIALSQGGTGGLTAAGTTRIVAQSGDVSSQINNGNVSLSQNTRIDAARDLLVTVQSGNFTARGITNLTADRDIRITLHDGFIDLRDNTLVRAEEVLRIEAQGGISSRGIALLQGATGAEIVVGTGGMALTDESILQALTGDVDITIGEGDMRVETDSRITAHTGNMSATMGDGGLLLTGEGRITAPGSMEITIQRGGVVMEDAETLLSATDVSLIVKAGQGRGQTYDGTIWIDRIEGTDSVRLEAWRGAIRDNTRDERQDLIVTQELALHAGTGIGQVWWDNLNVDATTISATNTIFGGINIQARQGFAVGPQGIWNSGMGSIVLMSGGTVTYDGIGFGWPGADMSGDINNMPWQHVYMFQSLPTPLFNLQLGNISQSFMQRLMEPGSSRRIDFEDIFRGIRWWDGDSVINFKEAADFLPFHAQFDALNWYRKDQSWTGDGDVLDAFRTFLEEDFWFAPGNEYFNGTGEYVPLQHRFDVDDFYGHGNAWLVEGGTQVPFDGVYSGLEWTREWRKIGKQLRIPAFETSFGRETWDSSVIPTGGDDDSHQAFHQVYGTTSWYGANLPSVAGTYSFHPLKRHLANDDWFEAPNQKKLKRLLRDMEKTWPDHKRSGPDELDEKTLKKVIKRSVYVQDYAQRALPTGGDDWYDGTPSGFDERSMRQAARAAEKAAKEAAKAARKAAREAERLAEEAAREAEKQAEEAAAAAIKLLEEEAMTAALVADQAVISATKAAEDARKALRDAERAVRLADREMEEAIDEAERAAEKDADGNSRSAERAAEDAIEAAEHAAEAVQEALQAAQDAAAAAAGAATAAHEASVAATAAEAAAATVERRAVRAAEDAREDAEDAAEIAAEAQAQADEAQTMAQAAAARVGGLDDRPVLQLALALADDELDNPLFAAE